MLYEDLLTHISKSGTCYRWTITVFASFLTMKSAYDMFVLNLITASVPYHCSQAIVDNKTLSLSTVFSNFTVATNFSAFDFACRMPRFETVRGGAIRLTSSINDSGSVDISEKCTSWSFKPDPPTRWTMFMEYEMVCDNKHLMDRMQTVSQLGVIVSSLFGPLGDIIGRKPFLVAFCYLDIACNIAIIFVKDLTIQMVLRAVMGFGVQALFMALILITELVGEEYRDVHGNLFWVNFVIGYCSSAGISYLIVDWRMQMVAVVLIIGAGYATYIPLLPESPRWLLTQNKTKEAKETMKKICRLSGCKDVLNEFNFEDNEILDATRQAVDETKEANCIFKLLPRDNLCRVEYFVVLGVISFNFFTVGLVYYALCFQRDFIVEDPYLNVFISGILELPAYLLAWQMSNRIGRKYTTLSTVGLSGLGLIVMPYIPTTPGAKFQISSGIAMVVKFGVTLANSVLNVYGSEVLPTKVRSCSYFFACFMLSVGLGLAPELSGALESLAVNLSYLLYGGMLLVASALILLLPETKNKPMPNTVAEMETLRCPCVPHFVRHSDSPSRQKRQISDGLVDVEEMKPLSA